MRGGEGGEEGEGAVVEGGVVWVEGDAVGVEGYEGVDCGGWGEGGGGGQGWGEGFEEEGGD